MKKLRLKRWAKISLTLLVIHISFFIWKQMGIIGSLAQKSDVYLVICVLAWFYLIVGQILIYEQIWK